MFWRTLDAQLINRTQITHYHVQNFLCVFRWWLCLNFCNFKQKTFYLFILFHSKYVVVASMFVKYRHIFNDEFRALSRIVLIFVIVFERSFKWYLQSYSNKCTDKWVSSPWVFFGNDYATRSTRVLCVLPTTGWIPFFPACGRQPT